MDREIITIYCVSDDLLKSMNKRDDNRANMSTAEIMTTALVAAKYFSGNHEKARSFMKAYGYVSYMLSKSQFNRRLHAIGSDIWSILFSVLARMFKQENKDQIYIVDSFPIAVCDNVRISRCKIYQKKKYHGYIASKKKYFYGIKVHMLVSKTGKPVEFLIEYGATNDVRAFKKLPLNLEKNAKILGDKAYNDYAYEDFLASELGIHLIPQRKINAKRKHDPATELMRKKVRKRVETTFSSIANFLPKVLHAVTAKGFELKIFVFIVAYAFTRL